MSKNYGVELDASVVKFFASEQQHGFGHSLQRIATLTFKSRMKSRLQFAGIIRSSPYSTSFYDKD